MRYLNHARRMAVFHLQSIIPLSPGSRCLPGRGRLPRLRAILPGLSARNCFAIALLSLVIFGEPGTAHAQRPIGIDVSDFQSSSLNWTTIKGYGVSFGWAKATEGTTFTGSTFA